MAAKIVSLTEAKNHLRILDTSEDALIQLYIDAASDFICNYLDTPNPPNAAAIKAAALLLVAGMFENRESEGEQQLKENPALVRLLYPYREGLGV